MISWPWLLDVKLTERIQNPVAPLDSHDQRPALGTLLHNHQSNIQKMQTNLQNDPLFDARKHDDVWLLRFLLSHKDNVSQATAIAKETMAYRREHNLDDGMMDIRGLDWNSCDQWDLKNLHPYAASAQIWLQCCDKNAILTQLPHQQQGQLVSYMLVAGRDQNKMMDRLTEEQYIQAAIFLAEWLFQWTDYLTRYSGRLSKCLRLADCKGVQMSMLNKKAKKVDGKCSLLLEDKYPQMTGYIGIINAPKWISIVFAIFRLIIPKRMLEKMSLINPARNKEDLALILPYCGIEKLPVQYGGKVIEWPLADMMM